MALFIFAFLGLIAFASGDPCDDLNFDSDWGIRGGSVGDVFSCARQTPLDSSVREQTLDILKRMVGELYSFTDIALDSGSPFDIQNDAQARLEGLRTKTYENDFDFHKDIANIFVDYYDAHTIYNLPQGYAQLFVLNPFFYSSRISEGVQEVYISAYSTIVETFYPSESSRMQSALGKTVTHINGEDAMQYFLKFSDRFFHSKGKAGRFNHGLEEGFSVIPLDIADNQESISLRFQGSSTDEEFAQLGAIMGNLDNDSIQELNSAYAKTGITRQSVQQLVAYAPKNPNIEKLKAPKVKDKTLPRKSAKFSALSALKSSESGLQIIKQDSAEDTFFATFDGIPIVVMTTMLPGGGQDPTGYIEANAVVDAAIKYAEEEGHETIIIDLRGNGGGSVCWAADMTRQFVPEFDNLIKGDGEGINALYDVRFTPLTDAMSQDDFLDFLYSDRNTGIPLTYWFNNTETYTRGGATSQYSEKMFIDCTTWEHKMEPRKYEFKNIIMLTDGLCGSACSQFSSKLRVFNKAIYVGVGGVDEEPFETSSFCGGNVFEYNPEFNELIFSGLSASVRPKDLPTSATSRYNFAQAYIPSTDDVPREFKMIDADERLEHWVQVADPLADYEEVYQQVIEKYVPNPNPSPSAASSFNSLLTIVLPAVLTLFTLLLSL